MNIVSRNSPIEAKKMEMKSSRITTNTLLVFIVLFSSGCTQSIQQRNQSEFNAHKATVVRTGVNHGSEYSPAQHVVTAVGKMNTGRAAHTATLLPNGKVLVCGGFTENTLASAELYDPISKTFKPVANMTTPRSSHSATLLPNGNVLIAGGYNGDYLSSTEIFDPRSETFTAAGTMTSPRSGHTATLLQGAKILLAGGVGTGWSFLQSVEVYDIQSKKFISVGSMSLARESHTATLLKSGKVLIAGGHKGRRADIKIFSSAEIFDPASGRFTTTGSLTKIHHKHDAVLLADGKVLITGGADERDGRGAYSSAEIYNPSTGTFSSINNMNITRYKHNGTSVLLKNGNVLIAGGADRMEVYLARENRFILVNGNLGSDRLFSCVVHLHDDQVLLTGGYDSNILASTNAWVYSYEAK